MRFMKKVHSSWWLAGTLILMAFAVYGNVYSNDFLYDDEFLIQKNRFLRSWDSLPEIFRSSSTAGAGKTDSFFRPLQTFLYLCIFQLFDLSTAAFHFLNVLLHACNSVLVLLLARRLGIGVGAGFVGALIWVVHPVHTESVTYMSATADPLHALFVLAGLVTVIPGFTGGRVLGAGGFFALGLLSKEAAIVFPALVVVCLFYVRKERWHWRTYLVTWPFWLMALVYLGLRKTILNFDDSFHFYKEANVYTESIYVRTLTFLATLPEYLKVLFYPVGLHIDRNFPVFVSFDSVSVMIGAGLLLGAVILGLKGYTGRNLFAAWVVLWFFAAHVPHAGILMPMNSLFLEHWLYLSSVSFFLAVGVWAFRLASSSSRRRGMEVLVAGIVIVLGARTWDQNRVWATPVSLYSHILHFNPKAARVHNNLAMAYSAESDLAKSIEHYERAIELSDVYPETHHNLALAYLRMGQVDKAIEHLEKAVRMAPNFFFSYEYLAHAYEKKGDRVKAQEFRRRYHDIKSKFYQ